MAKFKVGDKVRILDVDKIAEGVNNGYSTGEITLVVRVNSDGEPYILNKRNPEGHPLVIVSDELRYIKKVCEPSENQRITALEKEIAELRYFKELAQKMEDNSFHDLERIEALENRIEHLEQVVQQYFAVHGDPSTVDDTIEFEGKQYKKVDRLAYEGDVVVFVDNLMFWMRNTTLNKPYLVNKMGQYTDDVGVKLYACLCEVYEPMEETPIKQPKTPNQQRKEIIEKAKEFVDENGGDDYHFEIDEKEGQILAWKVVKRGVKTGLSTCHHNEVFNEDIGRAIAFGRAENLDVSEFENAIQPTDIVEGMEIMLFNSEITDEKLYHTFSIRTCACTDVKKDVFKILNDTNAIY